MKAAEIIGCDVFDLEGAHIGKVHDLRFERQSDDQGSSRYRLTGFECGPAAIGHRLGYGRGAMAGPWLFRAIFRFLMRDSVVVEWHDVSSFERPRIEIAKIRSELGAALAERS